MASECLFTSLPEAAKSRYQEKINAIDGVDPYEIPSKSWICEKDRLPDINHARIVQYFVLGTSAYTCEQFAAYKSLGAYTSFISGWVRDVKCYQPDGCENTVVTAKVLHSQRLNEKPLSPWLICSSDGRILSAHCNCMAGLGETCTHVAAMAFTLDAYSQARERVTCTGVPAYWKVPSGVKGVTPQAAYKIDFSSARSRKENLDVYINSDSTQTLTPNRLKKLSTVEAPTVNDLATFFKSLSAAPNKPNILYMMKDRHVDTDNCGQLPPSLLDLYDSQCLTMNREELHQHCANITVSISEKESDQLEKLTRAQVKSRAWFLAKAGRVTASNMHAACHTDPMKPSRSLVKKIVNPRQAQFSSQATQWGQQKESIAKAAYLQLSIDCHQQMKMRSSGLYVPPRYPHLGASPDAIICCECHGSGCLEIKCPFSHRYHIIEQALEDKQFCLKMDNGEVMLRKTHSYYAQVQTQIFLTGLGYCDFVIWTTVDMKVIRILPDQSFWDDCVEKATRFFRLAILPELVARLSEQNMDHGMVSPPEVRPTGKRSLSLSPQKQNDTELMNGSAVYCFCRKSECGRMVACDNKECKIEWFHYKCVNVKSKPKGVWFCPACAPNKGGVHKKLKNT